MFKREDTRVVEVGKLKIGGGNPVVLQSMCNTKTEDIKGSIAQILRLAEAGCELIRLTVPTKEAAFALKEIKAASPIPIVADIHFDYRMAILAMENGADKIRINPGNIGSRERLQAVVDCATERKIPIRIGVNSGSLEKEVLECLSQEGGESTVAIYLRKEKAIKRLGKLYAVQSSQELLENLAKIVGPENVKEQLKSLKNA